MDRVYSTDEDDIRNA